MPVLALILTQMPSHARLHAARPERASDVDVIPLFETNPTPSAYVGRSFRAISENQGVGAGQSFHETEFR